MSDFEELCDFLLDVQHSILVLGDFNIHVDEPGATGFSRFADILATFCFKQHVNFTTHSLGHTLDLMISRCTGYVVIDYVLPSDYINDHCAVHCSLSVLKPSAPRWNITQRRLADVNIEQFRQDIFASQLGQTLFAPCTVESMITQYNHVLGQVLDEHATQCTRSVYISAWRS